MSAIDNIFYDQYDLSINASSTVTLKLFNNSVHKVQQDINLLL